MWPPAESTAGVDVAAGAGHHQGVAASGAEPDDAHPAVAVRLRLEEQSGPFQVVHGAGVRRGEKRGQHVFRLGRALPGVEVRGDCQIALSGEAHRDVLVVVHQPHAFHGDDDAGVRSGAGRAAVEGIDCRAVAAGVLDRAGFEFLSNEYHHQPPLVDVIESGACFDPIGGVTHLKLQTRHSGESRNPEGTQQG